jgi:hypothetical protein
MAIITEGSTGASMHWSIVAAALALAGCAEPMYAWNKSGPHDFNAESGGCKAEIAKRLKETPPLYAMKEGGSPSQRNVEWSQRTYNDCMTTLGYVPTRELTSAEAAATKGAPKSLETAVPVAVTTPALTGEP